jgi:uncharacterized protein YjbI with pentapeptide repeats
MTLHQRLWPIGLGALLLCQPLAGRAGNEQHLMRLLESQRCPGCKLQDADLVQADLRDAQLKGAQLQRANLSGARLDGADLRGANLSFTSLAGASLRGADLRGSDLHGTDLRQADLSGALLNQGALSRAHWDQARGIDSSMHSYAELHNAGVTAAQSGRHPEAEQLFGEAIRREPDAAISWVARGISRIELNEAKMAAQDLSRAADLYRLSGDIQRADELERASEKLLTTPKDNQKGGNGAGAALLNGAAAALSLLGPIALKALLPL